MAVAIGPCHANANLGPAIEYLKFDAGLAGLMDAQRVLNLEGIKHQFTFAMSLARVLPWLSHSLIITARSTIAMW